MSTRRPLFRALLDTARLTGVALWRGFTSFYRSDNMTYAASIAYYSLLSMFPFALLAVALAKPQALWPLLIPLFISTASLSCVLPNATACAMAGQGMHAGSASALIGSLQFCVAAGASALVGALHDGSALPMAQVIALCGLASLTLGVLTAKHARRVGLNL